MTKEQFLGWVQLAKAPGRFWSAFSRDDIAKFDSKAAELYGNVVDARQALAAHIQSKLDKAGQ